MAVTIKLYVFAHLRDALSVERETQITLNRAEWPSGDELRDEIFDILCKKQSGVIDVRPNTIMLAMNEKYIDPGVKVVLCQDDVLALIPPVSGG